MANGAPKSINTRGRKWRPTVREGKHSPAPPPAGSIYTCCAVDLCGLTSRVLGISWGLHGLTHVTPTLLTTRSARGKTLQIVKHGRLGSRTRSLCRLARFGEVSSPSWPCRGLARIIVACWYGWILPLRAGRHSTTNQSGWPTAEAFSHFLPSFVCNTRSPFPGQV